MFMQSNNWPTYLLAQAGCSLKLPICSARSRVAGFITASANKKRFYL